MIVAIVPAAGLSTRMGKNKLFLTYDSKFLIVHAVDTLLNSAIDQVIVVVGHEADKVKESLRGKPVTIVENADYRDGLSTSIRTGLAAAPAEADAIMIFLPDQPLLEPGDVNRLARTFAEAAALGKSIVVPFFKGQRGNPVILDASYRDSILEVVGDVGCRRVIKRNPDRVFPVEMETDHVVRDVDTLQDYEALPKSSGIV